MRDNGGNNSDKPRISGWQVEIPRIRSDLTSRSGHRELRWVFVAVAAPTGNVPIELVLQRRSIIVNIHK
jgi:hypothetical protein